MLADIEADVASPELFLLPRTELAGVVAQERVRPVLDLVSARGVSIGDDFERNAQLAFTTADTMHCMPYTISPMVIYYNTDLLDFEQMREAGVPVPRPDGRWNLRVLGRAAEFATRPRGNTRGIAVDPSLTSLAPFIYSGGGRLFDHDVRPTSLALSEGNTVDALVETLSVLRESQYTLTDEQLERRTPEEWFERGRLGMLAGYRDLVPRFRDAEDLNFDVLPMPRLANRSTIGSYTGLCIAQGEPADVSRAADLLVHIVGIQSVSEVVNSTGSLSPAHRQVAFSPDYLRPDLQPERSAVFTAEQRYVHLLPVLEFWDELEDLAADYLEQLFTAPTLSVEEIEAVLAELDEASRALLDPDYVEPDDDPDSEDDEGSEGDQGSGSGS
jgi:multiple sugar transport system substrate-binding protein